MVMDTAHNAFLRPLRLPVALPYSFYITLFTLHAVAIFLPWFTSMPFELKQIVTGTVFVSFFYYAFTCALVKTAKKVQEVVLDTNDDWQLILANGNTAEACFGDRHYIHPLLTLLELRQEGSRRCFVFTPGNVDRDRLRRLRVRMKHRLHSDAELTQ